ncbi:MAG: 4-(cytidine 5'-diphospho)-2-C-methyl-D-erythritol kinase, partial [Phycisphaeraceae bacterium]
MANRMADKTLTIRCPAKLNLTLAVGPAREDGLHPIASVMVALDIGDALKLRRIADGPSRFDRRFASDAPKRQVINWPIERDLVFRASSLMEEHVGRALPVACDLVKRIPAGAGLGGGSSNAAAMLLGLARLYDLNVAEGALIDLARGLGADVAFLVQALLGRPAALVTGIGDIVEPIDGLRAFDCVLVFPAGACPTGAVYRAYDESPARPISSDLIESWKRADRIPPVHNDLYAAAGRVCPEIRQAAEAIEQLGREPRMTGSGSALWVVAESHIDAVGIADGL